MLELEFKDHHLNYLLMLLEFDDTAALKKMLSSQKQFGAMINDMLHSNRKNAYLAVPICHLLAHLHDHPDFQWEIDFSTESLLVCLKNDRRLVNFFNSVQTTKSIKTDAFFDCHLRMFQ